MSADFSLGHGLNIGGWISQSNLRQEHIERFFTGDDARRIAAWGFDNIRLPFDYPLLEDDDRPNQYKEEGFAWIDRGLEWARQADLKVALDMHKAPGFVFNDHIKNPDAMPKIFTDTSLRDRYYALWQAVARRYLGRFDNVAYELLNEMTSPDPELWNDLAAGAIAAIRQVDADRTIIVGSNMYNSCGTYDRLRLFDDDNIIYTFHFYEPIAFTHQNAGWVPELVYYGRSVPYPGRPEGMRDCADKARAEGKTLIANRLTDLADQYDKRVDDAAFLERWLQPVLKFRDRHGVKVYCGEFGVYSKAPAADRLRWYRDFLALMDKHAIDWSAWSYKGMGFGVVDQDGKVLSDEILTLLRE